MRPTRLFIIDSHDLSRNGLEMLVTRAQAPITLVGAYRTLDECRLQLQQNRPHVLLLDDTLPTSQDIFEVITRLCDQYPGLGIIVLSTRLQARYLQRLIQHGALGFIYKDDPLESALVNGIELVRSGDPYISPRASGLLFADQALLNARLNPTDLEVLRLMARGFTLKEIGVQTRLVPRSIYRIRGKLRQVLGVRTNDQIVAAAREQGLLPK